MAPSPKYNNNQPLPQPTAIQHQQMLHRLNYSTSFSQGAAMSPQNPNVSFGGMHQQQPLQRPLDIDSIDVRGGNNQKIFNFKDIAAADWCGMDSLQ